jgi:hypothetical protein
VRQSVQRIVSGGQTGADRGGLEAAIALKIPHGGWCPKGRRAEDEPIPRRYELTETSRADYKLRTAWNVRDSDATVVFVLDIDNVTPGTQWTMSCAVAQDKPCLLVNVDDGESKRVVQGWLMHNRPRTLNVAGSRESKAPGIEQKVKKLLIEVLQ